MGGRAERAAHRFLLIALWSSATVIAGVITWVAIARLGQEAAGGASTTLTQSEVRQELAGIATSPAATPSGPSVSRPAASRPTTNGPTSDGPAANSPTPTAPTESGAGSRQPARRVGAWKVAGGQLGTSCRGTVIRIGYATPADGWSMRVDDSGPERVRVEFSRGGSDSKLEVTCSDGVPVLEDEA